MSEQLGNISNTTQVLRQSDLGQVNGVASLDGSGLVPASQLPSYVDDVLEYADFSSFPTTGETGKIYVDLSTGNIYRWSGSVYVQIANTGGGSLEIDAQVSSSELEASTTSGTFVDVANMTITTSNTASTDYILDFSAEVKGGSGRSMEYRLVIDGVVKTTRTRDFGSQDRGSISISWVELGLATAKEIKIQFRKTMGSGNISLFGRSLVIYGVNDG